VSGIDSTDVPSVEEFLAARPALVHRVTLCGLTSADEGEFVRLVRASKEQHEPWMSLPSTPEAFADYLARRRPGTGEQFAIRLHDEGALVGIVNINSIIRVRFQNGSVSYAAFAPSAGRGYLTEGLKLVIRYAFEGLRLHRLEANIQPGNQASLRLVQRAGFRYEGLAPEMLFINGEWADHERWAITASMADFPLPRPHPSLPAR
jgi:ribosomal-protein-alanine N-acetyltransferase